MSIDRLAAVSTPRTPRELLLSGVVAKPHHFDSTLAKSYANLFEHSNVPTWQVHWGEVGAALRAQDLTTEASIDAALERDPTILVGVFEKLEFPAVNRATLELVGVPDSAGLDEELPKLLSSAEPLGVREMLLSYLSGGPRVDFALRMTRSGGQPLILDLRWVVAPHIGVRELGLSTARDRTAEELMLREVVDSEARYRRVVEDLTEFVVRYREGGVRTFVNAAYAEYFDSTPEELVGTSFLDLITPGDRERVLAKLRALEPGGESITDEHEVITPDGGVGYHEWTDRALQLEDGSVEYQSVGRDITQRVLAERSLRQAYQDLQHAHEKIQALQDALHEENRYLRREVRRATGAEIVGASAGLKSCLEEAGKVAPTESSVLLLGETGVGKEILARSIHAMSTRSAKPFVTVNCAALPANLIESELFGHARGAFTGATRDRRGRFALANGGTLFLDEIGELPPAVQGSLLRVLQDGEFQPVGADRSQHVDVRLIAATNRDLAQDVESGRFRKDLFYRLNVFPIAVPPLRERREDIQTLATHFLERKAPTMGRRAPSLSPEVIERLQAHDWPGNVRELQNVMEGALIRCDRDELRVTDLGRLGRAPDDDADARVSLAEAERRHIVSVLNRCEWRIKGVGNAAELLQLSPSTLRDKMKRLGIRRPGTE